MKILKWVVLMVVGGIVALALLGALLTACGSSRSSTHRGQIAAPTTTKPADVTDMDGFTCPPKKAKYGRCPGNPYYGKKPAQVRALKKAKARAEAKARAKARAEAAARAKARAAAIAAANAWHKGYYSQDDNVYWRWVHGRSCQDFAENGCWHVEVITRYGCQSYVGVEANEYQGSSIVGDLLDNNGNGIPPKTPVVFELDADAGGNLTAGDVSVTCE
jgi:hypothetical protein